MKVGRAFVVWGKDDLRSLRLGKLGDDGYVIRGMLKHDHVGQTVSGAGDLNNDGRPDFLVGSVYGSTPTRPDSGLAFAIYGSTKGNVHLTHLGANGIRAEGRRNDHAGNVAGQSDLNGDGCGDFLIGADLRPRTYVIWGCGR